MVNGGHESVTDQVIKDEDSWKGREAKLRALLNHWLISLRRQFNQLISNESFVGEYDTEGDAEVEREFEQLVNMTKVPFRLERFMSWTLLACFDCFLHLLTAVPLKIVNDILSRRLKRRRSLLSKTSNEGFMVFMIVVASVILSKLDTSMAYHRIKRQSSVKLYMLFGVLEMADKMLASMGQSLITIVLAKNFQKSRYRQILLSCASIIYLVCHGYVMVYQTVALHVAVNSYSNAFLTLLLSMQFAEIKAALLKKTDKEGLFQLAIADVVERSQLIFLLMIIAIRNLVAKSKSQSNVIPNSWNLHATSSVILGVLCGPMFNVVGSELIVDWVKHAYVTKFNRIRPRIYDKFLVITCRDYVTSSHKFCDRLGLPIPALVVLFMVMMRPTISDVLDISSWQAVAKTVTKCLAGFAFMVLIKLFLRMTLMKWAEIILSSAHSSTAVTEADYVPGMLSGGMGKIDQGARAVIHREIARPKTKKETSSRLQSVRDANQTITNASLTPLNINEIRRKKDLKNPHSLEGVARYKMVSKRIW